MTRFSLGITDFGLSFLFRSVCLRNSKQNSLVIRKQNSATAVLYSLTRCAGKFQCKCPLTYFTVSSNETCCTITLECVEKVPAGGAVEACV